MNALLGLAVGLAVGLALAVPLALALAKRAERRARDSEKRARDAEHLAYVGTLTGGLAHEIRNPLSTLRLNLELLREDLDRPGRQTDPRTLRRLDTLDQETKRLSEILDKFLQFAGKHDLDLKPSDVNTVLEELVAFYQERLERANVRFRTSLAAGLPLVDLDADRFKQAVSNLVLNAEAAMPGGGDLMIRSETDRGGVLVHVTDTGAGIPPEELDKIFAPYYSTRKGGTGLGLPTVRRIVIEHGGSLDVHGEPGRGTRFTIRLPAGQPKPHAAPTTGTRTDA